MAVSDLVADLEDGTAVVRQQHRGHELFPLRVGVLREEFHFLAHVLVQQLLRVQQVVLVVLLQDDQAAGIDQGLDMHARWDDLGSDSHELELALALGQLELPLVLHEAQVRVVDGKADGLLVIERAGRDGRLAVLLCGEGDTACKKGCCCEGCDDAGDHGNLLLSGLCPIVRVLLLSRFWTIGQLRFRKSSRGEEIIRLLHLFSDHTPSVSAKIPSSLIPARS